MAETLYRLFYFKEIAGEDVWKEVNARRGDDPVEALRDYAPAAGRWLLLDTEDETYHEFLVNKRTETDIEPAKAVRV